MTIVRFLSLIFPLLFLVACAVNPVTGKNELTLVSQAQELAIGNKQYALARQSQGGDYYADVALTAYVQQVGQRLARVSDRSLPYEFVVLNSSIPNAWALPGGKIALNRGLLVELNSEAELAAVLGHEIVHAAARHSAQGMERGLLLKGVTMAAGMAVAGSEYSTLAMKGTGLATNLVNQKYSRDAERESDQYGMIYMARAGYDPQAAITLQETFVRLNQQKRENWLSGLFASHPPSMERVRLNRAAAAKLKVGGERGVQRFQKAIAHLKKVQPAYEAYQKGRKSLETGNTKQAITQAKSAIKTEPKEGLFHTLLGDALSLQGDHRQALTSYHRAIQYSPGFFHFYEKRGAAKERLGDRTGARADMEQAARLFPNANAYLALGRYAEDAGDKKKALYYFRHAASSSSKSGKHAKSALLRLDLPINPSRYLHAGFKRDQRGNLQIMVNNPTSVPVEQVRVRLNFVDAAKRHRTAIVPFNRVVYPGKVQTQATSIGPLTRQQLKKQKFQVHVEQARIARF